MKEEGGEEEREGGEKGGEIFIGCVVAPLRRPKKPCASKFFFSERRSRTSAGSGLVDLGGQPRLVGRG